MADKSSNRPKTLGKQSKQTAAVATTLAKARSRKLKDPKKQAVRWQRAERSDDDDDDDGRQTPLDEEPATPLSSEDGLGNSDAGRDNRGASEDLVEEDEDPPSEEAEVDSDDGATTKEQLAKMKVFSKNLLSKLDGLQALLEQHGVSTSGSGDKSTGKSGKKKLIPIPANRLSLTVDELQAYLGIEGNHDRWLAIRNHARGIVAKADFNWDLSWGQQSLTVRNQTGIALRQVVTEFEPFVSNWGANYMIQDTFNHKRNRPAPAKGKGDLSTATTVKIDKRKRAYKAAKQQDPPAASNGAPVGIPTGPGVGASAADTPAGPATTATAPADKANKADKQPTNVSTGNNIGSGSGRSVVTSHPSIDSTLKESSQVKQPPSSSRPPSKSPAKGNPKPRPRPVTRSSSSTLDLNSANGALTRSKKATVQAKTPAGAAGTSKRKKRKDVDNAEDARAAKKKKDIK